MSPHLQPLGAHRLTPVGGELAPGQSVGQGRFVLQRVLGGGGMGVVWLAEDRLLREPVALKFLPPALAYDPVALQGLRRETLRARKLSHPNVVRIHDLSEKDDEQVFLSMEYVDGPNLHTLRACQSSEVFSWPFLAPLAVQLCSALAYAHGQGIIHRDVKPANLMVNGHGCLKLADFGLARVVSDSISRTSQPNNSGTLCYMSPQQADGCLPQAADDIYALGATLYELLTSTAPFFSGDVSYQLRHHAVVPVADRLASLSICNDVPREVSDLILSCLSKEPENRPASAAAILDELERTLAAPQSGRSRGLPTSTARGTPGKFSTVDLGIPSISRGLAGRHWGRLLTLALSVLFVGGLVTALVLTSIHERQYETTIAAPLPIAAGIKTEPVFETLFNGRDLTGWDGDRTFWSVKDGAITASTSAEGITRRENTCLIWHEPVDDFELRLSFRLRDVIRSKPANSGVLYRARRVTDWQVRGYQADLHGAHTGTLLLLEDTLTDPRTPWGKTSLIRPGQPQPLIEAGLLLADPSQIKNLTSSNEWNELVIVAQGNRLQHFINGILTTDATDTSDYAGVRSGLLALELKRATVLEFKEIRLKRLTTSSRT